ncbi:hypothetical protein GGQ64_000197 [Rhizobium azooxidifex]|uniref:Uncharacterized protein n=1 Tax=Mycoplana azooxidifex TaxID=1636188 RepID=A0A7W6D1L2_9HYPH|nr:hypothetical protein [Mycoplana azooxidifex]
MSQPDNFYNARRSSGIANCGEDVGAGCFDHGRPMFSSSSGLL